MPIEIRDAPKRVVPNKQPIIKLRAIFANKQTTIIYIKFIDVAIRNIIKAEKYFPKTILVIVDGEQNSNWSVCSLYSSLNNRMVNMGVSNIITINSV